MASSGTAGVSISGLNNDLVFDGDKIRVHKLGHIWLLQDDDVFTLTWKIKTDGFTFDSTSGNGKSALLTSRAPNPSAFQALGIFKNVSLSANHKELSVDITNVDGKYYFYGFVLVGPSRRRFKRDPIIVNKIN